jgi:hypothetical protein
LPFLRIKRGISEGSFNALMRSKIIAGSLREHEISPPWLSGGKYFLKVETNLTFTSTPYLFGRIIETEILSYYK